MKRVLLCAVLAGACSSRASGLIDFDSGPPADRGAVIDSGVVTNDAPAVDVPAKGTDVPMAVDAGFPEDIPVAVDVGFPEDIPVAVDIPQPMDLGPTCRSDRDCSAAGLVCDLARGACVECVRTDDCLVTGQSCVANRCVAGFDSGTPTDRGMPTDRGTPTDTGLPRDAGPGATLLTGLGGPNGFGPLTNCMVGSDDGSYTGPGSDSGVGGAIPLGSGFGAGLLMRGLRYPSIYLNNNGNVSFGGPVTTYSPNPFPRAATGSPAPLIAPWWGDVDTRGGGQPARNHVCFVVEPTRFVATWYQVGFYTMNDTRQNSFQVIITPVGAAGDFDVEFRYSRCEWTTGDASGGTGGLGGTPAQAGVDLGDGVNFLTLPGSLTNNVLNLCSTSNGSTPGVWRIQVRSGAARFGS